jgi:hypothetical protein
MIANKVLSKFIRIFPLLKSERLSSKSELTPYKALIRCKTTYTCLACGGQPSVEIAAPAKESSAPLVTNQGAHRPALYIWRSRFRTYTII